MRFVLRDSGEGSGSLLVNPVSIWTFRCGRTARGQKAKECPANFNSTASPSNREVQVWSYKVLFDPENIEKPFADYYRILGVSKNATEKEIKKA